MYIKSVTIEGLHNVARKTYKFDQNFNYLHGQNGAGKSTVLQAIKLALLGYIPGTDKNKSAIFAHASSRLLSITLLLDDNGTEVTVTREWIRSGTNILPSISVQPGSYNIEVILRSIELPIFNFTEFVGMTANKLKDWFINFLPSAEFHTDWETELRQCLEENNITVSDKDIAETIDAINGFNLSGVDEIRSANERFKMLTSVTKSELQRITSTVQSLIYYEDAAGVDKLQLAQDITDARVKQKVAVEYNAIVSANAKVNEELCKYAGTVETAELDPYYVELESARADLAVQAKQIDAEIEPLRTKYNQLSADILKLTDVANSSGVCPYTKTECESVRNMIEDTRMQLKAKQDEFDKCSSDLNNFETSRRDIASKFQEASAKQLDIKHRYERRDALKATLLKLPEGLTDLDIDVSYWNNRLAELSDLQAKVIANEQYTNLIDTMTKQKFEVSNLLDAYKVWDKLTSVNGLQSHNSGTNPFDVLINDMKPIIQKFFGDDVSITFVTEGKSNSFSYGLTFPLGYVPYDMLSSGEKCLFNLALLISIIKFAECPLKLVMIDDSFDHLDDINIDKVFESLLNMKDIQMIFAGVKVPTLEQLEAKMIEIGG